MDSRFLKVIFLGILIFIVSSTNSFAGWLIYHKPAFKGKVIDAETKKTIEGAVVVAVYNKTSLGPVESYTNIINVKETLTDKNGEFYIPSYTTIIQPFSWEAWVRFIIYKPEYGSYPDYQVNPPKVGVNAEEFFTRELGKEGEIEWGGIGKKTKVIFGIVELPKLKTREERLKAIPGSPTDYRSNELPLLYKAINEEYKKFGLDEVR